MANGPAAGKKESRAFNLSAWPETIPDLPEKNLQEYFKNSIISIRDKTNKIGLFCSYVPEELILAGGFIPVRITGSEKLKKAEGYLPINYCPYIKASLEYIFSSNTDYRGFVFTNSCDGMRRLYDLADTYAKSVPSFMLDVPRNQDEDSIDFFTHNLTGLAKFIKKISKDYINPANSADMAGIEESFRLINKKKALLRKLQKIFKEIPEFINVHTYFRIVKLAVTSDPLIFTDELEKYLENLKSFYLRKTLEYNPENKRDKFPRIMIIGNFIAEEKLWEMLAGLDFNMVADDTCIFSRYFGQVRYPDNSNAKDGSPVDLMNLIGWQYLKKSPCARMSDLGIKLAEIEDKAKKFEIDGVLFISLKFCDTLLYSFPLIKQRLKELKIPVLYLEIEYNNFSEGQLKTRIQAFLEML